MNTGYHEQDYRRVVGDVGPTHFLPGSGVEVIRPPRLPAPPRHVLFDFDGTLSLIRRGWPDVMVPMMVEVLRATGTAESPEALHRLAFDFVMELNGKQTIYQMIRLAEEVRRRGGRPEEPLAYKQAYHQRLMQRIAGRRAGRGPRRPPLQLRRRRTTGQERHRRGADRLRPPRPAGKPLDGARSARNPTAP